MGFDGDGNRQEQPMELIERCRRGDRDAFSELFERYKNLVYRTAYLMLGDAGEADEVLQEVFLSLFAGLASYRPEKSAFSTWLYRVTFNRCLNRRRRQSRLVGLYGRFGFFTRGEESSLERAEDGESVRQALRRLSPPLRAVIILRYYQELSYAEIAAVLEISPGTVKSRINLAHQTLSRLLRPDFPERLPSAEVKDELPTNS
ncbi:MAG: RNA polymerase sigma factor [Chloroflexi bacterium]|nr:RNA polymerase sigma factor [Chloroflexota bacterium]